MRHKFKIQYISDVHVDVNKKIPIIKPICDTLAICGDIGVPTHDNFKKFLSQMSSQFKTVLFVAGNHDYDCGCIYHKDKIDKYKPIIKNTCDTFSNVHFLDNSVFYPKDDIMIIGSTLWSNPLDKSKQEHLEEHTKNANWIETICDNNSDKKIIVLTHFVPTFKLIEPKYLKRGLKTTSFFATDLEHFIKKPIVTWLCGHTHSVIDTHINNVYCGVNSYGYPNERNGYKYNEKCVEIYE